MSRYQDLDQSSSSSKVPLDKVAIESVAPEPNPTKKTKGKQKINIEYIESKQRRQISFYKRKNGLIKKAHELSTLTGSELLLLVASETGHIYTYATDSFQPIITDEHAKSLIQNCVEEEDAESMEEDLIQQGLLPNLDFSSSGISGDTFRFNSDQVNDNSLASTLLSLQHEGEDDGMSSRRTLVESSQDVTFKTSKPADVRNLLNSSD